MPSKANKLVARRHYRSPLSYQAQVVISHVIKRKCQLKVVVSLLKPDKRKGKRKKNF